MSSVCLIKVLCEAIIEFEAMKIFPNKNKKSKYNAPTWDSRPQDAERYWEKWIGPKLSKDQKVLLAEHLFAFVWQTAEGGPNVAPSEILNTKQQVQLARVRFDRGCHLWNQQQYQSALFELRKSLAIQEAYGWVDKEMEVQLHYALGMVHIGLRDWPQALDAFRHSWRLSGLHLGTTHRLTKSSQHMFGTVLSHMGFSIIEVDCHLNIIQHGILHEQEGDFHHSLGDLEMGLQEYHRSLPEEQITLTQAAIRCKVATLLEEKGDCIDAGDEWATALTIYQSLLGSHHPITIQTMQKLTANHAQIRAGAEL